MLFAYNSPRKNNNTTKNMLITLQIPADKYGAIATEAALAGKPLDAYIVETSEKNNFKPVTENDISRIRETQNVSRGVWLRR